MRENLLYKRLCLAIEEGVRKDYSVSNLERLVKKDYLVSNLVRLVKKYYWVSRSEEKLFNVSLERLRTTWYVAWRD